MFPSSCHSKCRNVNTPQMLRNKSTSLTFKQTICETTSFSRALNPKPTLIFANFNCERRSHCQESVTGVFLELGTLLRSHNSAPGPAQTSFSHSFGTELRTFCCQNSAGERSDFVHPDTETEFTSFISNVNAADFESYNPVKSVLLLVSQRCLSLGLGCWPRARDSWVQEVRAAVFP